MISSSVRGYNMESGTASVGSMAGGAASAVNVGMQLTFE